MRSIQALALILAAGFIPPSLAWGQMGAPPGGPPPDRSFDRPMKREFPPEARQLLEKQREEMQALREKGEGEVRALRQKMQEEMGALRQKMQQEMRALRQKHQEEHRALRQKLHEERKGPGFPGGPPEKRPI